MRSNGTSTRRELSVLPVHLRPLLYSCMYSFDSVACLLHCQRAANAKSRFVPVPTQGQKNDFFWAEGQLSALAGRSRALMACGAPSLPTTHMGPLTVPPNSLLVAHGAVPRTTSARAGRHMPGPAAHQKRGGVWCEFIYCAVHQARYAVMHHSPLLRRPCTRQPHIPTSCPHTRGRTSMQVSGCASPCR
jgi:hypothetical protein